MNRWQERLAEVIQSVPDEEATAAGSRAALSTSQWDLVARIHERLIDDLDSAKIQALGREEAREAVETAARATISELAPNVVGLERDELAAHVADEVLGLGPIEPLVNDPSISEVLVNAPDIVYFEREGIIYRSDVQFRDFNHIMRIAERIIAPLGRRVDEASPYVDARLADGSRVNIIIPPVAPDSPTISIRKFRADRYKVPELIEAGTFTDEMAQFLRACVRGRLSVLISGGAATGKTTLLNALSAFIPESERIVTIEDPNELKLQQPHVVRLEARPPNLEGRNAVTQRDLVRNSLRMRPDRIIVGEVRGSESFDMLQAMNTGHEGSLTTVHANSPRDALARVENMVLMAGFDLPVRAIREQIASAIHLVLQLARFVDGSRKIVNVSEISGMESQTVTMQELFRFYQEGLDDNGRVVGQHVSTGIQPRFAEQLRRAGIPLPAAML
jgi:pilus assembly protein CpaF